MWIPSRVTCAAAVLEISGKTPHGTPSAAPRPIPQFHPVCALLSPYFPLLVGLLSHSHVPHIPLPSGLQAMSPRVPTCHE